MTILLHFRSPGRFPLALNLSETLLAHPVAQLAVRMAACISCAQGTYMPVTATTVTISQALHSMADRLLVLDSAANVAAALPNPALLARVASFTITATAGVPSVLSSAQLLLLASLGSVLHAPAGSLVLNSAATLSVAQLSHLETLPGFLLGNAGHITLSDSLTNISALLTAHPGYFAQAASIVVSLDGTSIGAYQAIQLNGVASHGKSLSFTPTTGHTTLNITASAHDLGTDYAGLNALGARQALSISLTNSGSTVGASDAAGLVNLNGFTVAGRNLSVADTAANVQAQAAQVFGHGFSLIQVTSGSLAATASQLLDSTLHFTSGAHATLNASTTQTAAGASALAALPGFALATGAVLAIADSAVNLAQLPSAAAALAGAEILNAPAIVSAATALQLATLAHLSLGTGATLTVQDSLANLLALGRGAPAITSLVTLAPGSGVTITAAQGHALAAILHFSPAGATITVADSLASLTASANAGWQSAETAVHISDTAANLAAAAGSALVQSATVISLSANAQITAAAAAQIASISNFTPDVFQLTVVDTAAAIAASASAAISVAHSAIVTDSGPISAAIATQLTTVSQAGKLAFQGGDQLIVQDSLAALNSPANRVGLALASRIAVVDTATNLVAATSHDWGGVSPTYNLSQGAIITGAQANTLAGVANHFSAGGNSLSVADTAAAVLDAAASLTSLGITASVFDTAGHLGAQQSALLSLTTLNSVHVTDSAPVTAATAASMSGLAAKLVGTAFHVADTASDTDSAVSGLAALGSHVTITVTDSAANVAPLAADLATLGSTATIALTDNAPVNAGVAAALLPVQTDLAAGTRLSVSDTASALVANVSALASLGSDLGIVSITTGTTLNIASVVALAPIAQHLALGVQLTAITTTAATVSTNLSVLQSLASENRLAAIQVDPTSVQDATTNAAALNVLPCQVAIIDTPAAVQGGLDSLAGIAGLQSIQLVTNSTATFTASLATLHTDAAVFADIVDPYRIAISDSAANIIHDLTLGSASLIAAYRPQITAITATGGAPVVLTQAQILATGIDDGSSSALSVITTQVDVTGVDIAHVAQIATLPHAPTAIAVADTSAAIAADLALGSNSALVSHLSLLSSITSSTMAPVTLTAQQILAPHIDDAESSAIGLLHGATLLVIEASVSQLPFLSALQVPPASIAIADTAANLSADLASGNSALVSGLPRITAVSISDGGTITLTESQLLAIHVDDGTGSVLSETTGGALAVTQVAAGDLALLLSLGVPPGSISITDTAAHVVSHLSSIEADIGSIAAITVTSGPLILTAGEALSPHVDDRAGSIIDRLATHAFNVTGASVGQLPSLLHLADQPGIVTVNDSAGNILADLTSGNSALAAAIATVGTITTTHGTLSLSDTQANTILNTPALDAIMAKLAPGTVVSISGVPVGDIAGLTAAGWPHVTIAVADSEANIAVDLAGNTPTLAAHASNIASVALSSDAVTDAVTATELAGLPHFTSGGFQLTIQDDASAIAQLGSPEQALASQIVVLDSTANIGFALDSLQAVYDGNLIINVLGNNGAFVVSASQYVADKPTIDAIASSPNNAVVVGSAAAIASLASQLRDDVEVIQAFVQDSAANTIAVLNGLQPISSKLLVLLTDPTISAVLLQQLLSQGNLNIDHAPSVVDTAAQIAALAETGNAAILSYLSDNHAFAQGSNVVSARDAAALEGLNGFRSAPLVVWDTAAHLSSLSYATALASSPVTAIYLKTSGGGVTVTAATLATLYSLPNFASTNPDGSANTLNVSDTASHLDAKITALLADAPGHVASITVNAPAIISAAMLADLQSVGAVAGTGVQLSVLDTAAAIVTGLAASSPSIRPAAWLLSGNGTVTEGQAVTLANLAGFSANGHSITLSINADTQISLSDIQSLASIAGALNLNGHHLIVSDTVAHLTNLSPAALALATPAITDSLANVAALPSNSQLLHGTIEITDAAAITAAQASSVTTLAGTLAPGAVTIDHMHAVADTISNLRSLIINPAWTANSALQSSFTLAAQDIVSNLVNPSNTAFLHGLAASSLPGNVTTTAASATALASLAAAIHFSQGANHITVSDTAAHLLSANNAAGLALASTVTLAGPEQLDAADAEQLLQIDNLSITTPITIADNSTNLLDGALGGLITNSGFAAYITVQLVGPEILDADAAESLVNLPGFSDTHNLSIADSSSYLLNGGNLSAEQMASSVTLAGDETVSAHTIQRLSQVPHFSPGSSHLVLAGNDYADAATLKAVADEGAAVQVGSHTITMAQDVLDLSPAEYAALQADHVVAAGHALGVSPGVFSLTNTSGTLNVFGLGVAGGTVHVYTDAGDLITSDVSPTAGYTVHAADAGRNFAITETVGGVEGAPLVVLDAGAVEAAVAAAHGSLAAIPGGIQVDSGKYITLYQAGSIPQGLQTAALVYDPVAHTIALDVAGNMTTLITLGGTAHPSNLNASDILFKQHG